MGRDYRCSTHGLFSVELGRDDDPFRTQKCPTCQRRCELNFIKIVPKPIQAGTRCVGLRREWRGPYYSSEKGRWFSHRGELDQWYKDNNAYPMLDSDLKRAQEECDKAGNDARREEAECAKVLATGNVISDDMDPGIEPED